MKMLNIILCLMVTTTALRATPQVPEKMNYDGETFGMYSTPLDEYFGGPRDKPALGLE